MANELVDKIAKRPILYGQASYYTNASSDPRWGKIMKNGKPFDENAMTFAVPPGYYQTMKNKTYVVESQENGNRVLAKATDTGGFEAKGRTADLSLGLFKALGHDPKQGTAYVRIKER